MWTILANIIVFFVNSPFVIGELSNDAQELFGRLSESDGCIEASLSSMEMPQSWETSSLILDKDLVEKLSLFNISTATENVVEVSATARINDVVQFNKIQFYYEVIHEEGPPHQKLFKVALRLGDETYVGEGSSIKKAKADAAELALENTEYRIPALKLKDPNAADFANTPTVQLNNAAAKLGVSVRYEVLDENPESKKHLPTSKAYISENKKSYLTRLNYSIHHPDHKTISVNPNLSGQPFVVRVHVGENNYIGIGQTVQAAKHDAAAKAIDDIKREGLKEAEVCTKEGTEAQCKLKKDSLKSPISSVYELADRHNIKLNFEIVEESGKSHDKVFVTRCTFGDLTADGRGKSKKESKRRASEAMLQQTAHLPAPSDLDSAVGVLKSREKKNTKKAKKKVIRNQVDKLKMHTADLLSSVADYFSTAPVLPEEEIGKDKIENAKQNTKKNSKPDYRAPRLTPKDELLRLTQAHGLQARFSKFANTGTFYTIVSLNTKPPQICMGDGLSDLKSQEKATLRALNLLGKLGFDLPDSGDFKIKSGNRILTEGVPSDIKLQVVDFDEESDK